MREGRKRKGESDTGQRRNQTGQREEWWRQKGGLERQRE